MREKYLKWQLTTWLTVLLFVFPILAIFYTAVGDNDELFAHLFSTVLSTYTLNTFLLVFGTMFVALIFALPSAWFMARCQFPSAKILQWALILPLSMPSYIVGYIYTDWFDFAGPVQRWIRNTFQLTPQEYWFPDLRSLPGAILILALVLYPYIYLLTRSAFIEQNASLLQSARLLKCTAWQSFFHISLPLARPAIMVGLSLVAMEALGDFGTVSYFAVNTLTTAVYDTWLGYSNLTAAAKISSAMLLGIVILISTERYSRRKQKHFQKHASSNYEQRHKLEGWKKYFALTWCWGLVFTGFILPIGQLFYYNYHYLHANWSLEFQKYSINSIKVSISAALITVFFALIVNFYQRIMSQNNHPPLLNILPMRLSSLGYAVPGTVLAIGIMVTLLTLDHGINDLMKSLQWTQPGLLFSSSIFAIVFAFVIRFAAVAIGSIESSLAKISPNLDMSAKVMGCNTSKMLKKIHIPLIFRGILIAALLVFIESMKELNASILLRPFNFETLATYIYNYASDQQLELASLAAILLVFLGLIPLIFINRSLEKGLS